MRHLAYSSLNSESYGKKGGRGGRLSTGVRLRFVLPGVYRMACRDWNRHVVDCTVCGTEGRCISCHEMGGDAIQYECCCAFPPLGEGRDTVRVIYVPTQTCKYGTSVVDPDPSVFGHPGSGSSIILYGSGSFRQQAKKL